MNLEQQQEELSKILKGRNSVTLDFSNPEQEAYYLKEQGGEQYLKTKYQAVYEAFRKTKEEQQKKKYYRMALKGAGRTNSVLDTVTAAVDVPQIVDGEEGKSMECRAHTDVSDRIGHVSISGYVSDVATRFTYAPLWDQYDADDIINCGYHCEIEAQEEYSSIQGRSLETTGRFEYVDTNKLSLNPIVKRSKVGVLKKPEQFVDRIEISAPRSNKGNNPILITYKNRTGPNSDYTYENIEPATGWVLTKLPIEGDIIFNSNYVPSCFPKISTNPIVLVYQNDLYLNYPYTLDRIGEFNINGNSVHFKLHEDWGNLPSETYGHILTTSLSCPFFYQVKDKSGHPTDLPFLIRSKPGLSADKYYISTKKFEVFVPPITYQWGCFGKNTKVCMADGSYKVIQEIKVGEKVAVYENEPVAVKDIITGTEERMICVETKSGESMLLSTTHPVLTKRGIIQACHLNMADQLMKRDRTTTGIKYIYDVEYRDKIYNLDLGSSHLIIAEGLAVGDMHCQNEENERARKKTELSQEAKELIEEIKELKEEQKDDFLKQFKKH